MHLRARNSSTTKSGVKRPKAFLQRAANMLSAKLGASHSLAPKPLLKSLAFGGGLLATSAHAADAGSLKSEISLTALSSAFDPAIIGATGLAIAAFAWAIRIAAASQNQSANWSSKLAEMEAELEKASGVLAAHPGLVLVWDDYARDAEDDWGAPKIFGSPAALASLMSFSSRKNDGSPEKDHDTETADAPQNDRADQNLDASLEPIGWLLDSLGDLPLEDDGAVTDVKTLRQKVYELRTHGIAFSGVVMTTEGRGIEAAGRVAGGQATLWLTDPDTRMAEDMGLMGKVHERTADLHGALNFLERAPMPAWRRSTSLELVWVNKAYVDAVEAPSAAAVLKDQIELDPAARKIAETAAAEKRPADGRVIVNMHGERRVLKVSETPMHALGDAAIGGFASDITELDKTRTTLSQHIDANRRTLDEIPTAVALFGAAQELLYYNTAFLKLWAFDDAELVKKPTHSEVLDRLRQAGKLPEQADYAAWKKNQLRLYTGDLSAPGSEREGDVPDEIWHLSDGRTLRVARKRHPFGGVLTVFEDVTEKMQLERRFNTQISVQNATLNNLSEAVAVFAANGALRLYNEAFQKLWRADEAMLDTEPHVDKVIAALDGQIVNGTAALADIKRRATSMSPEDRHPIENGAMTLSDGRSLAFGTEPLPDGATLVHFLDVTDSKEREKELKERNALLEDIDRQKSKFVDHISYQLRTPLATIIGFAEMMDGQMFGVLNDRQKDYIASILSASHHLRDLVTDIIDLAVIDAGKMSLELGETDIRNLLENAATYAALKAEDTQVILKVDCPKDIGALNADEKRLKQVLFNLLSNAFAYTNAGGEVSLGADRAPGLVRLWVQDSGRGVSPEDQSKAFDPFVSHGPSAGAGIGLALVKRFVDLHGGWVRMESTPGSGTRVTCYLPANLDAPQVPQAPSAAVEAALETPKTTPPLDAETPSEETAISQPLEETKAAAKSANGEPKTGAAKPKRQTTRKRAARPRRKSTKRASGMKAAE